MMVCVFVYVESQKFAFQIVTASKSFVVIASCHEEKFDWMVDIANAIADLEKKDATFVLAAGIDGGLSLQTESVSKSHSHSHHTYILCVCFFPI